MLRVHLLAAGHCPGIYSGIARWTALGVGLNRGVGPLWIAGDQLSLLLIPLLFAVFNFDACSVVGQQSSSKDGRPVCPQCPAASTEEATPGLRKPKCSFRKRFAAIDELCAGIFCNDLMQIKILDCPPLQRPWWQKYGALLRWWVLVLICPLPLSPFLIIMIRLYHLGLNGCCLF